MPGRKLVAINHIGKDRVLSEEHTIRFVFHDFVNLPHERNKDTISSALCHGYQWELQLSPGGNDQSNDDTVHLSLYLNCVSAQRGEGDVKAKSAFRVPSTNYGRDLGENLYQKTASAWGFGYSHFLLRSDVLDPSIGFLVDGNLTIEVDIQVYVDKVYVDTLPAFRPKHTLDLDMMKLLESAKHSDVKFQVGPEVFSAHRGVLQVRAPELAAVAEGCSTDAPIPIQGVTPSAFRSFLRFVYGNAVPESEELLNEARELLDVANRFGCKGLKLLAEAELVDSGITVDTAVDLVLLGDAKNCALLKEAAIDFFAANPTSVMSSSGWGNIRESVTLVTELMEVLVGRKKPSGPADADEVDYKRMCVSTLRQKLEDKGLNVDGSRDMLISRLEEVENGDGSSDSSSLDSQTSSSFHAKTPVVPIALVQNRDMLIISRLEQD
jgi:speckle-type POZ protein